MPIFGGLKKWRFKVVLKVVATLFIRVLKVVILRSLKSGDFKVS